MIRSIGLIIASTRILKSLAKAIAVAKTQKIISMIYIAVCLK